MDLKNEEKTTFGANVRTFYYKVMPFSLKNAKATYQKMVTKLFKGLIGRNMKVYIDDILVKNLSFEQYMKDLGSSL